MILAGDVHDGTTVPVSAGAEGLLVGGKVATTSRRKPDDAVVH
jgi:ATP-dependent Clp protease ATP-binding subunit ClpB